jgi:hypothetical protein
MPKLRQTGSTSPTPFSRSPRARHTSGREGSRPCCWAPRPSKGLSRPLSARGPNSGGRSRRGGRSWRRTGRRWSRGLPAGLRNDPRQAHGGAEAFDLASGFTRAQTARDGVDRRQFLRHQTDGSTELSERLTPALDRAVHTDLGRLELDDDFPGPRPPFSGHCWRARWSASDSTTAAKNSTGWRRRHRWATSLPGSAL